MSTSARVLTLLLTLLLIAGCPAEDSSKPKNGKNDKNGTTKPAPDLETIQKGKLIVALEPIYTPFEMKTTKGKLIGFDVEMIRLIAEKLGLTIQFTEIEWKGIIAALQTGKVDCICSGMSVTDERKKVIDFSDPYYQVGQAVLINVKDKDKYKSYADLDKAGLKITVQLGTTGEKAAREKYKTAEIKPFPKSFEAAQEVKDGRAAGFVFDHPYIAIYAMRNKEFVTGLMEQFTKEPIGIAVQQERPKLLKAINAALADLKADGTLDKLEKKYFVDMPWLSDVK